MVKVRVCLLCDVPFTNRRMLFCSDECERTFFYHFPGRRSHMVRKHRRAVTA